MTSNSNITEAAALAALVTWSVDCPAWQRDALRRLCTNATLETDDVDALLLICKMQRLAEPLSVDHVRDPSASQSVVTLKQLHGTQHVNALAPDERLSFSRSGLTVIYGDNGSGKSGYARVLKKMCRARTAGRAENILPNIYDGNPGIPSASIDFIVNGQNKTATWTLDQASDAALSAVSVFDARTASVHVDQTNDVAYTPYPLKLLAALAQACQTLKERLNAEIKGIEKQTPQAIKEPKCQPTNTVGKLFSRLAKATPEEATTLATLSAIEIDRLTLLNTDLAADPVRAARQLLTLKTKIEGYIARITTLAGAVSDQSATSIRDSALTYYAARDAAAVASSALFKDEPLPTIGTTAWRALWEAARHYSEHEAYPDRSFPVVDDPAVCVLCQQDIGADAARRLGSFETFIKDDSKRREASAKSTYDAKLASLAAARVPLRDVLAIRQCIADELADAALTTEFRRSVVIALWRLREITRLHANAILPQYTVSVSPPISSLNTHVADFQRRATAMTTEADSPEHKALIAERDALADRQWLASILPDFVAEIGRLQEIFALQTAIKDTTTNRITSKSTEIADALVTNALRAQFAIEIDRIGVAALAIELKQERSAYGIPRFKVALTRKPDAGVGEVLSEGEHRCVALAAFLAELATSDSKSAIVFDDPVSSLDHMHREAVAKRLVEEALSRQIIVFTHDIAFLFLLDEACGDMDPKSSLLIRSISRGRDAAGYCNTDPPLKARPLADVIAAMQSRLDNEKIHHERGNQAEWEKTVRSLQEQLRTSWERAVEETVAPVIKRLSSKVNTPGLVKLTAVTREDCEAMRDAFSRCSALLHSEARELNTPLPDVAKIQAEIIAIKTWVDGVKHKQSAVRPI
jgi:ABC-type transport system involved in cytochrome c biogenesis ATPase subunit